MVAAIVSLPIILPRVCCVTPRPGAGAWQRAAFARNWHAAFAAVTRAVAAHDPSRLPGGAAAVRFDVGVRVWKTRALASRWSGEGGDWFARESGWPVKAWVAVDHHLAHAVAGFYVSPFASALVASYDGSGNDGCFAAYHGARGDDGHHARRGLHAPRAFAGAGDAREFVAVTTSNDARNH